MHIEKKYSSSNGYYIRIFHWWVFDYISSHLQEKIKLLSKMINQIFCACKYLVWFNVSYLEIDDLSSAFIVPEFSSYRNMYKIYNILREQYLAWFYRYFAFLALCICVYTYVCRLHAIKDIKIVPHQIIYLQILGSMRLQHARWILSFT